MLIDVNGVRLAYTDAGEGSPAVLLVHGFPLNRSMWDPQLGRLRARTRVVVPDLRGFGASEAGPAGILTMDQHADDLATLLNVLGVREPVVYCGLSMGGYVAFSFWRRHPELVRAFVFADTRASEDNETGRQGRLAMAAKAEETRSPRPAIDAMLPVFLSPEAPTDGTLAQRLRGMMATSSARAIADGQRGLAARPDSFDLLPSITVPCLVLVGDGDQITPPSDAQKLASGLPRARLEMLDHAGHMSNLENPEAFNEALEGFLESLRS
jgi:pimeloyl-ACP methyl ester carboxylesterase